MEGIFIAADKDAEGAIIEVAGDQGIQFLPGMGIGIHLAQQAGEEPHVMNVFLRQCHRVQIQRDVGESVHAGYCFNAADTALIGDGGKEQRRVVDLCFIVFVCVYTGYVFLL